MYLKKTLQWSCAFRQSLSRSLGTECGQGARLLISGLTSERAACVSARRALAWPGPRVPYLISKGLALHPVREPERKEGVRCGLELCAKHRPLVNKTNRPARQCRWKFLASNPTLKESLPRGAAALYHRSPSHANACQLRLSGESPSDPRQSYGKAIP